ncbi:MAG: hypothetical protein VX776_04035, partial [Planctomycetota bacterium]|nr:hypothetical protein [Planctomycetota bacterium]
WMAVTGTLGIVISLLLAVPHLDSMIVASFVGAILALVFGYVTRITFLTAAGTLCIGLGVWSIYLKTQYGASTETLTIIDLRNSFGDGMSSVLFTITAVLAGVSHYFFATVENRDRPEFSQAGYLGVLLLAAVGFLSAIASHLPVIDGSNRDLTLGVFAIYAVAALAWSTCSVRRSVHLGATVLSMIAALKLANTQFVEDWHWLPSVDFFGRLSILCWTMLTAYVLTGIAKRVLFSGPRNTVSSDSAHQSDSGDAQFALNWTLSIVTLLFVMTSLLQFHIYLDLAAYSTAVGQGIMLIVIALLLALTHRTDWTWMLVQIQTMITVGAVVTLIYSNTFELADEFRRWTWGHIKIQMIVLSLGMLAWTVIRKVCQQSARAQQVVVTDLMYVDFVFHALATVIVYGIWVFSLVGPLHKVYPESEFLESLLSFYETGQGFITMTDWSLWVVNLLAWISVIPDRHRRVSSFFGLLTLSALPMLVSTSLVEVAGGNEKALINYLKWGYGLFGLAVTALVCTDQWWWRALQNRFPRLMANQDEKSEGVNAEYTWMALRIVSFVAASLPVIVLTMAHFVYTSSVSGIGGGSNPTVLLQSPGQISEQVAMWNFGGPFFLLVIAAWICAVRSLRPLYLVVALPMWLLGWMFFDLINVWADGDDLTVAAGCGTFKWGLLGLGIYGLVWAVAGMKTVGRGLHQLFQRSAASTFVYGFMMVTAVLLMLAAVFDAFIVIDHVSDLDQWLDDWKPAFADWAAFVTAIILPLACWIYDRQWEGRGKISYFVIALLTLNANLAHWLVTDVPETSVLFNQTIGWLIAITLAVAAFGYLARFVWDQRAGHEQRWDLIRANQSYWIGGISCLSMMSYLAIGIFLSIENVNLVYSDGLLLSLMGIVVVVTLILSHLIQDGVPNVVSLLFATPLIILLAIKCSSLGMESVTRIIPDLAFVLEKQDQAIVRLIMGGFGAFAILGYLIQSGCQVVIGLPQHRDQISLLIRRGLLSVVLTAFLIHSVVALILTPHFQNVIWVHFPADLLVAGILLVALYVNARGTRFDSLIPLAYILGLGCGATLLVGWYQGLNTPHTQEYYFVVWMSLAVYLGLWGVLYRFKQAVISGLKTAGV